MFAMLLISLIFAHLLCGNCQGCFFLATCVIIVLISMVELSACPPLGEMACVCKSHKKSFW